MKLSIHETFEYPASLLWQVIGEEFGDVADWGPGLESSYLEGELGAGCTRVCSAPARWPFPKSEYRETLLTFDRGAMKLSYRAVAGLPSFLVHEGSCWVVVPLGPDRCRLEIGGGLRLRGPMVLLTPLVRWQMHRVTMDMGRRIQKHVQARAVGGATQ